MTEPMITHHRCPNCSEARPRRLTGVFELSCPCGATIQCPDSEKEISCRRCGRISIVPEWGGLIDRAAAPFRVAIRPEAAA